MGGREDQKKKKKGLGKTKESKLAWFQGGENGKKLTGGKTGKSGKEGGKRLLSGLTVDWACKEILGGGLRSERLKEGRSGTRGAI